MVAVPNTVFFFVSEVKLISPRAYGFLPGSYESGEGDTWTATQTNKDGEKISWTGTVDGDRMTGTFTWDRNDGDPKTYSWKAKRYMK